MLEKGKVLVDMPDLDEIVMNYIEKYGVPTIKMKYYCIFIYVQVNNT